MTLTRVGHLDTLIRIPDAGSAVAGRVDNVARERLPTALGISVARAVPTGPEVVVIRRVDVVLDLEAGASFGPEEITARWAEAGGAAAAAIAGRGDEGNVVRFPDEASFVARFVGDLLAGRAWGEWCYGAFGDLRDLPPGAAIARVLTDHARCLTAILGALRRDGTLELALFALGAEDVRAVWEAALGQSPQPLDAASALPIATAALAVASRLRLPRPTPEPAELAATHHRWAPEPLDWSDRRALADAVCRAFAEIVGPTTLPSEPPRLRELATAAVRDFDWLDRERLVTGIVTLLDPAEPDPGIADRGAGTAALRRILEALGSESALEPAQGSSDPAVSAMRLLAALAERDPELAERPEAAAEVERLVSGIVSTTSRNAAVTQPASVWADGSAELTCRRCDAAGVLLLARGLADTHLSALASRLELPAPGLAGDPSAALLLSVGLAVAGSTGVDEDGWLDPALLALLAREDAMTAAEVAAAWSSTAAARQREFRNELAELASGQRLGRPVAVPECRHPSIPGLARGTVARAAHLAIMAWARWLPGLADSTPAFLLGQLLRRAGSVSVGPDAVHVVLDPRPLDVVIELAGYLEPLERVPWLGHRSLGFARGEA